MVAVVFQAFDVSLDYWQSWLYEKKGFFDLRFSLKEKSWVFIVV